MGDNAKKTWEWHNTIVGEGYQAKGVVRQRHSEEVSSKVVDLRPAVSKVIEPKQPAQQTKDLDPKAKTESDRSRKSKKHHRRRSGSDSSSDDQTSKLKRSRFNPLLQAFSIRLKDNLQ